MKNKKTIILMIVAIITLLTLIIGATYAYFQASGNSGSGTDVNVVTATSDLLTFKIDKDINIIVSQSDFKKAQEIKVIQQKHQQYLLQVILKTLKVHLIDIIFTL